MATPLGKQNIPDSQKTKKRGGVRRGSSRIFANLPKMWGGPGDRTPSSKNFENQDSNFERWLFVVLASCFCLVLGYFVVFSILMPRYQQYNNTMLLDAAGAGLVTWGLIRFFRSPRSDRLTQLCSRKWFIIGFFVLAFVIQLVISYGLAINPAKADWDPLTVYHGALNLINPQHPYANETSYFQAFPNNIGIVGLLTGYLQLLNHLGLHRYFAEMLVLNALVMTAAFALTYLCAREFLSKKARPLVLLFGLVFITLSPWSRTFYSDTIGLLFPIASLYLLIRLARATQLGTKIGLALLLGVVAGCGYLIKPTAIFVLLAAAIVYGGRLVSKNRSGRHFASLGLLALCLIGSAVIVSIGVKTIVARQMNIHITPMPSTHFMMMGLKTTCSPEECRYGAWNYADAIKNGDFTSMQAYKQYTIQEIKHRLKQFGVGNYALFLSEKGAWVVGDGTFYMYYEGGEATAPLLHHGSMARVVQSMMHPSGAGYVLFENLAEVWLLVLWFFVLAPFFILKQRTFAAQIVLLQTTLLGLLAFLLLFEARSRYLYLYLPFFILLGAYGLQQLVIDRQKSPRAKRLTT